MGITRERIIEALIAALKPLEYVHALAEAGSAAFGRLDEYSDIDLGAECDDGRETDTLDAAEAALAALGALDGRWEMPQPAWHGMFQRFWHIAGSSEYLLVDFCASPSSKADAFTDPVQHGHAIVYFDKLGRGPQEQPVDPAELAQQIAKRLEYHRDTFPMFAPMAKKEVLRGRPLDALTFYNGMVLKPLIEVLRIRYCPVRHSFGMRYLQFDLPPEAEACLRELAFVRDADDLLAKYDQACAWFRAELRLAGKRQG